MRIRLRKPMIKTTDLRCEYAVNPLGVDTRQPRFTWLLEAAQRGQRQTAYRVLAASSAEKLEEGKADLWDSGKVRAEEALPVEYAGQPLQSGERCYWKACAWDKDDLAGPYSEPAWFEMGLLEPGDWKAEWIGFPAGWNGRALYFRSTFEVEKEVRQARVSIAGLGYSELRLNGQKVGDHVLDPGFTDTSKRVLYVTHDVGPYLKPGRNVIGVILGNGWHGSPRLLLQGRIDFLDGTTTWLLTGRQGQGGTWWRVSTGPILENSIYGGEVYDARLEKPGWDSPDGEEPDPQQFRNWSGGMVVDPPAGRLVSQMIEPIRVTKTLSSKEISEPKPGVYVCDMGQNIAGWARLHVRGESGTRVTLRYAESLYEDGTVNQENLRSAGATDIYICKGEGFETWEPRFTYHGFRYVQIEGYPGEPGKDSIEGKMVRSSVEPAGQFECSHPLLNRIHQMVWWTEASNQHSLPTDCPQRDERMGWLNDMGARTEEALYNFNLSRFLPKWLDDIEDAQDPATGAISDTAPYRWGSRPADPVSVCYLMIPWQLYLHYGDDRVLRDHYQGMKRWVDYLGSRAEGGILAYSYYGDWSPPIAESLSGSLGDSAVSKHTPGALISTGFYFYSAQLLAQIAWVLGYREDEAAYNALSQQIGAAYHRRFWDETRGGYGSNNQACNAFSIYMRLVPEACQARVLENLAWDVLELHQGHLTTGNLCTKYLLEALAEGGRGTAAFAVAAQETYPSWGFMLANGATTLWERWESRAGGGMNSHNHPMMGSVGSWFYKWLVGIQADPQGPGFTRLIVRPYPAKELAYARAALNTVRGRVEAAWEQNAQGFVLKVSVPVGSQARVSVPKPSGGEEFEIDESGKPAWRQGKPAGLADGVLEAWEEESYVTFQVGSGSYLFHRRGAR